MVTACMMHVYPCFDGQRSQLIYFWSDCVHLWFESAKLCKLGRPLPKNLFSTLSPLILHITCINEASIPMFWWSEITINLFLKWLYASVVWKWSDYRKIYFQLYLRNTVNCINEACFDDQRSWLIYILYWLKWFRVVVCIVWNYAAITEKYFFYSNSANTTSICIHAASRHSMLVWDHVIVIRIFA